MERDSWLGVELRHLAALSAIERTGSFRGAADELGYVQSAVSQQVARLEEVVGARLILRSRGRARVTLTAAGKALLGHSEAIVARLTAAKADLGALVEGSAGTLRVGTCETAATLVLPPLTAVLAQRHPQLTVSARELVSWQEARDLVAEGELDLAFDYLPLDAGPFESIELLSSPCLLLVQAGSPLTRREEPPTLAEIAGLSLIDHPIWRFSPRLKVILEASGRAPRYSASSNLNRVVEALVAAGVGAAVLPALAVDRGRGDIASIDLSGVLPPARLALFWHRDRGSERFDPFVEAARDLCAGLETGGDKLADRRAVVA
jgi:DNA-binding transcriptional LysR family regulator